MEMKQTGKIWSGMAKDLQMWKDNIAALHAKKT